MLQTAGKWHRLVCEETNIGHAHQPLTRHHSSQDKAALSQNSQPLTHCNQEVEQSLVEAGQYMAPAVDRQLSM